MLEGDGEYGSSHFRALAEEKGFVLKITSPHSQKAWYAERLIGILRCTFMPMIERCGASHRMWGYAAMHAERILGNSTTLALPSPLTRNQAWEYETWDEELLVKLRAVPVKKATEHIFGCLARVKTFKSKMVESSELAMYLGREPNDGRYIVRSLRSGRTYGTSSTILDSTIFPCLDSKLKILSAFLSEDNIPTEVPPDAPGGVVDAVSPTDGWAAINEHILGEGKSQAGIASLARGLDDDDDVPDLRDSSDDDDDDDDEGARVREPSSKALNNIVDATLLKISHTIYPLNDPANEAEAMATKQRSQWIEAMEEEMAEIWRQSTYELVPRPAHTRVIKSRFVFKIKWKDNPDYNGDKLSNFSPYAIDRFKARWIAQGYNLQKGIDFFESYSFTLGCDSERAMIAIAIFYHLFIFGLDFKNFYLHGKRTEDHVPTHVEQPKRFTVEGKEDHVCLLKRALYGLPSSGRIAQQNLVTIMNDSCQFKQLDSEPMVFHKHNDESNINAGFYVDDGKFITNDEKLFHDTAKQLAAQGLEGKPIRNPTQFLGIGYKYAEDGSVLAHQRNNILQLIATLNLQEAKPCSSPIDPQREEEIEPDESTPTPKTIYQSICGQAIWLLQTRHDSAYTIQRLCRKMSNPSEKDYAAAKRFGRYLVGTIEAGLTYHPRIHQEQLQTYCYVDASFFGRCTSGIAVFLGEPDYITHINRSAAIICQSKRESSPAISTMEAELYAICRGVLACIWVEDYRAEMGYPQPGPSIIFTDSLISIRFLEETGRTPNRQTRHLRNRVAYIKHFITLGRIIMKFVPTALNCADLLTKGLPPAVHHRHAANLLGQLA
jgi:hypothetical protein